MARVEIPRKNIEVMYSPGKGRLYSLKELEHWYPSIRLALRALYEKKFGYGDEIFCPSFEDSRRIFEARAKARRERDPDTPEAEVRGFEPFNIRGVEPFTSWTSVD